MELPRIALMFQDDLQPGGVKRIPTVVDHIEDSDLPCGGNPARKFVERGRQIRDALLNALGCFVLWVRRGNHWRGKSPNHTAQQRRADELEVKKQILTCPLLQRLVMR